MFVSKKKWDSLVQRVEKLECNQTAITWEFGDVDFPHYVQKMPRYIQEQIRKGLASECNHKQAGDT